MESKSYQYSPYYCFAWVLNCGVWLYLLSRPLTHQSTPYWIFPAIAVLILWIYRSCEVIYIYLIPLIRRKPALQLDNEKLFYAIKNETISWSEIKEIKPSFYRMNSMKIILNNDEMLRINMSAIKGNDDEIYQNMLAHLPGSDNK